MRFRIHTKDGSSLLFRLRTREDGLFNFSINERFKGNTVRQIITIMERDELELMASRIVKFFKDVDNPQFSPKRDQEPIAFLVDPCKQQNGKAPEFCPSRCNLYDRSGGNFCPALCSLYRPNGMKWRE